MQLLLIDQDNKGNEQLHHAVNQWGYQLISVQDVSGLNKQLALFPFLRVVLLKQTHPDKISIVAKLRKFSRHLFIICLGEFSVKLEENTLFKAGIDDLIQLNNLEKLNYRLESIRRLSDHLPEPVNGWKSFAKENELQIINLDQASNNFSNSLLLFEKLLKELIDQLGKGKITSTNSSQSYWDKLYQNSLALGTEVLTAWLENIINTKLSPHPCQTTNHSILQAQLDRIIQSIKNSYSLLSEYKYFQVVGEPQNGGLLSGAKILIVEDLQHNRVLVKKILGKYTCRIVETENGAEAIELWKNDEFDLIIMDMNMPIMNGFVATKQIRQLEGKSTKIPILALTALAMRGDAEHCLAVGCDGYVAKPINAKNLIETCQKLLQKKSDKEYAIDRIFPVLKIENALLKINNQVLNYALCRSFEQVGIEITNLESNMDLMGQVVADDFDLVILDGDHDLHLAYKIKDRFPLQQLMLICDQHSELLTGKSSSKSENILIYPFQQKDIEIVLQHISVKLQQSRNNFDLMADVRSLKQANQQISIEECVQQSDNQLAIWQKPFRKIGGDLVLSHTFDLHGKFGFILADVAGHDIMSGYAASWFAGLVEGAWGNYSYPLDLLTYLNSLFAHDNSNEDKRFVCVLVLLWDRQRYKLHFANAGIPEGIMVKASSGNVETINWRGAPIGMFPESEMFDYGQIDFFPGDRLYMATDGILEAIPSKIIVNFGQEKRHQKPAVALASLVDFVTRSIEIRDDLTIALFEAHASAKPRHGLRLEIESTFQEVDKVMIELKHFMQYQINIKYDLEMVSLAIREALINAVEHGNQKKIKLPVDIDLDWIDPILEIRISDSGRGFDLMDVKKRLRKEGDMRIQGRGLEIIENIAHKVSFSGSGIKMEFLPPNSPK
jgi:CheY-like chemotaxis protein/anti-sigma regulatory factor (Ser/Thr protein kinase)